MWIDRGEVSVEAFRHGAVDRSFNGGFMRAKVVSVFSDVAELGLFFVAAAALCVGLLVLR